MQRNNTMWFNRKTINSDEYNTLLQKINTVQLEIKSLELDLQLYVKRLKASKGLGKKEEEETEDGEKYKNNVILPT